MTTTEDQLSWNVEDLSVPCDCENLRKVRMKDPDTRALIAWLVRRYETQQVEFKLEVAVDGSLWVPL